MSRTGTTAATSPASSSSAGSGCRRHDTPGLVRRFETELLAMLGRAGSAAEVRALVPRLLARADAFAAAVRTGDVAAGGAPRRPPGRSPGRGVRHVHRHGGRAPPAERRRGRPRARARRSGTSSPTGGPAPGATGSASPSGSTGEERYDVGRLPRAPRPLRRDAPRPARGRPGAPRGAVGAPRSARPDGPVPVRRERPASSRSPSRRRGPIPVKRTPAPSDRSWERGRAGPKNFG